MMIKVLLTFEVCFQPRRGNIEKLKEEAKKLVENDGKYYGWGALIEGIEPKIEVVND